MTDYTQRIQQLSENKRQQLAERLQALQDKKAHRQLVAFVLPISGFNEDSLRDHLAATLPDYMLPRHYVELETLPLTENGKIDRSKLTLPSRKNTTDDMTSLEDTLAAIWSEVLDMELIHADDDYFELGGDSITSIQIIARASKSSIYFSPSDLMEHPSIRQLAHVVTRDKKAELEQNIDDNNTDTDMDSDEMLRILDLD